MKAIFLIEEKKMLRKKGFTLIELLIVVAIIAILAAIAVPNFLEAQVRSKVSRAKADIRTVVTALESYYVDANHYPTDNVPRPVLGDPSLGLTLGYELTTPIQYLSTMSITEDVFRLKVTNIPEGRQRIAYKNIVDMVDGPTKDTLTERHGAWRLYSAGPDKYFFYTGQTPPGDYMDWDIYNYDPTNGTVSYGDIFRDQMHSDGTVVLQ
jgi:general secretion pathway protein G